MKRNLKPSHFALIVSFAALVRALAGSAIPVEPLEIGQTPQFFVDDHTVENRWAVNYQNGSPELVTRVAHQPKKEAANPLLIQPGEAKPGEIAAPGAVFFSVLREGGSGMFRLWYQASYWDEAKKVGLYAISYAESKDGLTWVLPNLGLIEWRGNKDNNVVWTGLDGKRAASPCIVEAPEKDCRGYRYLMISQDTKGINLIGSHDGIQWDRSSVTRIVSMHSDTSNCLIYDPDRAEYVLYCRSKKLFHKEIAGTDWPAGEPRRVARMVSKDLWTEWESKPQMILIPDEIDAQKGFTAFYGLTAQRYGNIYWGFLQPFKWNTEVISELAFSRDGADFGRLPVRTELIPLGPNGSWDDTMIFVANNWVEVGDEWWLYYSGSDGPHGADELRRLGIARRSSIGLARIRKEGFVSMRGPKGGGVLATRTVRWPGGDLLLNANAQKGEIRVRVLDENRVPIAGFDYDDCRSITWDSVKRAVEWNREKMESLAGRVIRLEFYLREADLYTFRARGKE